MKKLSCTFKSKLIITALGWLLIGFALLPRMAQAQGKTQTLVGTISDSTCGAGKHTMGANSKECTINCVKQMNSKYALVVGDKVYILQGKEVDLEKLAGAKAKVTGTVDGTNIKVNSVSPAS